MFQGELEMFLSLNQNLDQSKKEGKEMKNIDLIRAKTGGSYMGLELNHLQHNLD